MRSRKLAGGSEQGRGLARLAPTCCRILGGRQARRDQERARSAETAGSAKREPLAQGLARTLRHFLPGVMPFDSGDDERFAIVGFAVLALNRLNERGVRFMFRHASSFTFFYIARFSHAYRFACLQEIDATGDEVSGKWKEPGKIGSVGNDLAWLVRRHAVHETPP